MGSQGQQFEATSRKLRVLCLHGLGASGAILEKQISKWPKEIHDQVDFICVDAPYPAQGKSEMEGVFDPPYFEWVLFNEDRTDYTSFQETMDYVEECFIKHGPIDGLLGFAQGAFWVGALPGLQEQGVALTKVPKIKFVMIISGGKLYSEKWKSKAYANPISIPNLHFLGKEDILRPSGLQLLECYKDSTIIHHPENHTVPRIEADSLLVMLSFIDHVKKLKLENEEVVEATTAEKQTNAKPRKMRMLCLHGLRTSGAILQSQISKWPKDVHDRIDFFCIDAPFPAQGKSDVEHIFDPPYFEWVLFNEEHTEYTTFQETLDYIEECCIKYGPIDGLLGFSQGGIIVGGLPGLQEQGLALTKVPKIKFVIIIAGGKLRSEKWRGKAYTNPLSIPNLHFLGEKDFMKPYGLQLLKSCKDPIVIHHPKNHIVPRIVPDSLPTVLNFIDDVEKLVFEEKGVEATPEKQANGNGALHQ